jgi:hypothetical protein
MKIGFYGRAEVQVRCGEGVYKHYVADAVDANMYHLVYTLQERLALMYQSQEMQMALGDKCTTTTVEIWPIEAETFVEPLDQIFQKWRAEIERRRQKKQRGKVPDASLDLLKEEQAGNGPLENGGNP